MLKLEKMMKRIERLLLVFRRIVDELQSDINELNNDIKTNNETIENLKYENDLLDEKVKEFENLKGKIEGLLK